MEKNFVIDKVTKKVKKHGYCDFEINSETEELIVKNFDLNPDVDEQDWYWNNAIQDFQTNPI